MKEVISHTKGKFEILNLDKEKLSLTLQSIEQTIVRSENILEGSTKSINVNRRWSTRF